jgi:hypothetical protein
MVTRERQRNKKRLKAQLFFIVTPATRNNQNLRMMFRVPEARSPTPVTFPKLCLPKPLIGSDRSIVFYKSSLSKRTAAFLLAPVHLCQRAFTV